MYICVYIYIYMCYVYIRIVCVFICSYRRRGDLLPQGAAGERLWPISQHSIYLYVYMYNIYIYRERERER